MSNQQQSSKPKASEAEHIKIVTHLVLNDSSEIKDLFRSCAASLCDEDLDKFIARLEEWRGDVEKIKLVRLKEKEEKALEKLIKNENKVKNASSEKDSVSLSTSLPVPSTSPHYLSNSEHSIPTEVLRQLLQGDFLSSNELGRLLLFVSKSFVEHIGEDVIWANLCRRRWHNHKKIPQKLLDKKSHKWIFQKRMLDFPVRKNYNWYDLPIPPKLSADNLIFLISIRTQRGDIETVSETLLSGDSMSQLLGTGKTTFELENPYVLGEYEMIGDEFVEGEDSPEDETFLDWSATIHCIRLDDNKCCCTHKTSDRIWDEECGGLPLSGQISHLRLSTEIMELKNEWNGSIGNRIREHKSNSEQFGGYKLELDLLCFKKQTKYQNFERGTTTVELQFSQLRLQFWRRYYGNQGKAFHREFGTPKNGVTLLHILDELQGWDED